MHRKIVIATAIAALSAWAAIAVSFASVASAATVSQSVCDTHARGGAHCDATLLVRSGSDALIHPVVHSLAGSGRRALLSSAVATEPASDSPQWLQQAYDLSALSASRGTGDTVAIVDAMNDPAAGSDLATFRAAYGLPACTPASGCLRIVNQSGAASPLPAASNAWATEETLDLAAVSSICPNCNILLVEANSSASGDLDAAMQTAVNLGANQISDSWSITAGSDPFGSTLVRSNSANPAPIFAAAGDAGSDPLGEAEYPAALPSVTAVGGTTLTATSSSPRGFTETAWSNAGSGCAQGQASVPGQPNTGCAGRAYSDVSADADPDSGLDVYEAADGGWVSAGGTSLATPIVAAFAAITGISSDGPGWAYADAAALNDPVGGSDGSCAGLAAFMCNAGVGYDGPTGAGSISGAVTAGAPGIAGPLYGSRGSLSSVSATEANLSGGLYTNAESTTYSWQYGTGTAYGAQTTAQTAAAGTKATLANATLSGLSAGTTYHYRLVATNASGTVYGPDQSFTTPAGSGAGSSGSSATSAKPTPSKTKTGTAKRTSAQRTKQAAAKRTRQEIAAAKRRAAALRAKRAAEAGKAGRA